jgi:4-nitrophenyl phosphatase
MAFPYDRISALLIDLDGVLYRGNTALPDAAQFIAWLRRRGLAFRLVTNNATLTPQQYVGKLAGMGIEVEAREVFTSALATALFLRREGADGHTAYAIGETGLLSALDGAGIRITDTNPDWVVAGLDRTLTYEKLTTAVLAINAGARFVGTNPDTSLPTERGLLPGAGAIQAAITTATGVTPTVVGKPQPLMSQLALEDIGRTVDETAMLGDRLNTDIQGAAAVGMRSILVLTGVSTRADLAVSAVQPDEVVDTLGDLMSAWPDGGTR